MNNCGINRRNNQKAAKNQGVCILQQKLLAQYMRKYINQFKQKPWIQIALFRKKKVIILSQIGAVVQLFVFWFLFYA